MVGAYITVGGFVVFDILTGLLKAIYDGNLNSTALRKGLFHKISEILAVAGSVLLEYAMDYIELGVEIPVFGVVSVYICITELISILENLGDINPTLGRIFKPYLQKLKSKEGENELIDGTTETERK